MRKHDFRRWLKALCFLSRKLRRPPSGNVLFSRRYPMNPVCVQLRRLLPAHFKNFRAVVLKGKKTGRRGNGQISAVS